MSMLRRDAVDLDVLDVIDAPSRGVPGKRSMTQSLAPRPMFVFRVESAEAAQALGAAFGSRDRNGVAAGADLALDRAASGSGAPLRDDLRERFEASLGADLSAVRVHTSGASAEASTAVGAKAYTVGNDVHFGAGQYRPDDPFGLHLLAHEVAHTQQQAGATPQRQHQLEVSTPGDALEHEADRAADAMVAGQRASITGGGQPVARKICGEIVESWPTTEESAWNDSYDERYKKTRPRGDSAQQAFDAQRASGKVKSASSQSATAKKVKPQITSEQLHRIISAGGEKAAADKIAPMAGGISSAFETMMIDTAQAQADYLAHMAGETGGNLEEKEGEKRSYAPFQGRGAVQLTHPENYAKALGTLQQRADQIEALIKEKAIEIATLMTERDQAPNEAEKQKVIAKIDALKAEVEKLRNQLIELQAAVKEVKADPAKAADPRFAFLTSAAAMHMSGAARSTGSMGDTAAFAGNGTADSWVSGGNNGMTFEQRRVQNVGELAGINEQLKTEDEPAEIAKLQKGAGARERLIKDMESAKSRGAKKERVYAAGMRILSSENGAAQPAPDPADGDP